MLMASLGRDARYPGAEDKQRVLPGSMLARARALDPWATPDYDSETAGFGGWLTPYTISTIYY